MLWLFIGIVVVVVIVAGVVAGLKSSGPPSKFPPGTRAWEAELTMGPLMLAIQVRLSERDRTTDPDARAKLDRDIEFLSKQVDENQKIVDAGDLSPGRGYVGFQAPP
jgi:hypothetical protein